MKKKIIFILFCFVLCLCSLTACKDSKNDKGKNQDVAYAYCSSEYNASFGNYGSFSVSALEGELETEIDDLTKITLGGAFSGMKIEEAIYTDSGSVPAITFSLSGKLAKGRTGTVDGEGIIKGKSVNVVIPVSEAWASSDSKIYVNKDDEQVIELSLTNACFNKGITATDFVLSGAAKDMTIVSVIDESTVDENGNIVLSQTAKLTIKGLSKDENYATIEILTSATNYNETLYVNVSTQAYGLSVVNSHIDTFTLKDTVYIQADAVTFNDSVKADDISFGGALEDYATVESVDFIDQHQIAVNLSFPYMFVGIQKTVDSEGNETESLQSKIGYMTFSENVTEIGKEFICSVIVATPELDYSISINGKTVSMELTLYHEEFNEFNLLSPYPFEVYKDGTEVLVSGIDIVNVDEFLSITFTLPDNCDGLFYFVLKDAYSIIVSANGEQTEEKVTIKNYFYI